MPKKWDSEQVQKNIRLALQRKQEINPSEGLLFSKTRLHVAAEQGDLATVQLLVDNGAQVNALDVGNQTPLYFAAYYGHVDVVRYLIQKDGYIAENRDIGWGFITPFARHINEPAVLQVLLQCRLDRQKKISDAVYLLQAIIHNAWYRHDESFGKKAVQAYLQNMKDHKDEKGCTILHHVARHGDHTLLQLVLEEDLEVDAVNAEGHTPLWAVATRSKNVQISRLQTEAQVLKRLLQAGASVDVTDTAGRPLLCAQMPLYLLSILVDAAIAEGVNIDVAYEGKTALYHVVIQKYPYRYDWAEQDKWRAMQKTLVKKLIAAGADLNVKDGEGVPLLHADIETEIFSILIDAGIEVNPFHEGKTLLYKLVSSQYSDDSKQQMLKYHPKVRLNRIGPNALLYFLHEYEKDEYRNKGAFEERTPSDFNAQIFRQDTAHNNTEVVKSFKASMERLRVGKTPAMIQKGYEDFKKYFQSELFDSDVLGIGKINQWSWEQDRPLLKAAIEACPATRRYALLRREVPQLFARMEGFGVSLDIKWAFREVAGLIWLALTEEDKFLGVIQPGFTPEQRKAAITEMQKDIRWLICQRVFSFQYEYYKGGSLETPHPACTMGTVHHMLSILNGIHEDVQVTFLQVKQIVASENSALLARVTAKMPALVQRAYNDDLLQMVRLRLSTDLKEQDYQGFFNTGNVENTEHLFLLQRCLGQLKNYIQFTDYGVECNVQYSDVFYAQKKSVFILLEDVMKNAPLTDWVQWVYGSQGYYKTLLRAPDNAEILQEWKAYGPHIKDQPWFCALTSQKKDNIQVKLGFLPKPESYILRVLQGLGKILIRMGGVNPDAPEHVIIPLEYVPPVLVSLKNRMIEDEAKEHSPQRAPKKRKMWYA